MTAMMTLASISPALISAGIVPRAECADLDPAPLGLKN